MRHDFLVECAVGLLVERKLIRNYLLEFEDRGVGIHPDLEALAVLLAGLIHVDNVQGQLFGRSQARMGSAASQPVLLRVMDEHLDILEAPLDSLLLNRENLLVAEGTYLLIACI